MSEDINPHLDKKLQNLSEEGCVDTRKFDEGTTLFVETEHSVYEIIFTDSRHGIVTVTGGKRFTDNPTELRFNGCTWGGSCLKIGHLGKGMYMEFTYLSGDKAGKTLTTSSIQSAGLVAPDNSWRFELWEENDESSV